MLSKFIELPYWGIEKLGQAEMEKTFPRAYLTEKRYLKTGLACLAIVSSVLFNTTLISHFDHTLSVNAIIMVSDETVQSEVNMLF